MCVFAESAVRVSVVVYAVASVNSALHATTDYLQSNRLVWGIVKLEKDKENSTGR
jgi:hypothetical protein